MGCMASSPMGGGRTTSVSWSPPSGAVVVGPMTHGVLPWSSWSMDLGATVGVPVEGARSIEVGWSWDPMLLVDGPGWDPRHTGAVAC